MVIDRDKKLTIRVSEEEIAMLESLAEADGVTVSDYVRLFVRRVHAERFSDKKPKTKR